jgi:B-cell receptor-associated protein 31
MRRLKKSLEAVSKHNKTMLEEVTHGRSEESERDLKGISDAKKDA